MAQINTTVGDFAGNRQKILKAVDEAGSSSVDLITFHELAVCGYPPEDLLFKPQFIAENLRVKGILTPCHRMSYSTLY
ncbi:nitrilase-related carbon-nitrogen hydrolase [Chloroflexota bacterium]